MLEQSVPLGHTSQLLLPRKYPAWHTQSSLSLAPRPNVVLWASGQRVPT